MLALETKSKRDYYGDDMAYSLCKIGSYRTSVGKMPNKTASDLVVFRSDFHFFHTSHFIWSNNTTERSGPHDFSFRQSQLISHVSKPVWYTYQMTSSIPTRQQ